jgi:hypothetical protein
MPAGSAPNQPPRLTPPCARPDRRLWWLLAASLPVGALYYFFNPSEHGFFPICRFHQLSGLLCPGCGGQRALHHLLHGEIGLALRHNVLLFPMLGAGLWLMIHWLSGQSSIPRLPGRLQSYRWLVLLMAPVIVFTLLRNLPAMDWLRP